MSLREHKCSGGHWTQCADAEPDFMAYWQTLRRQSYGVLAWRNWKDNKCRLDQVRERKAHLKLVL